MCFFPPSMTAVLTCAEILEKWPMTGLFYGFNAARIKLPVSRRSATIRGFSRGCQTFQLCTVWVFIGCSSCICASTRIARVLAQMYTRWYSSAINIQSCSVVCTVLSRLYVILILYEDYKKKKQHTSLKGGFTVGWTPAPFSSFMKNSDQSVIIVLDILDDSPYLMTETYLCMSVKSRKKAKDQHFFRWLKML